MIWAEDEAKRKEQSELAARRKVQEEALKAGYGPTIAAESVQKLVDSVVRFQENSTRIIDEMRTLIREA